MNNGYIHALHERAIEVSKTYLRAEAALIDLLQEIDDRRAFRELGYRSVFEYATQALKLSESVAYNLITVARKAREVPALKDKIREQSMTLSSARMIAPVLTPENQERWISAAQTLSKRELEREVARENPRLLVRERVTPVSEDRSELKVGISEELRKKLKRVQDLVSTKKKGAASLEETLEAMADLFLEREDPLEKAKRAETRRATKPAPAQASRASSARQRPLKSDSNTRALPAAVKHAVHLKDGGRCTYTDLYGKRCPEEKWLDLHHVIPIADGGTNAPDNLKTLCRAHHQTVHEILIGA